MSKLIRYLIDLLYNQYIFEHMPLSHIETIHAQPCIFAFEKYSRLAHFPSTYDSVFTYADICPFMHAYSCQILQIKIKDAQLNLDFRETTNNFLY